MTIVYTSKTCSSCKHWNAPVGICDIDQNNYKYFTKRVCRRWQESDKHLIMRERIQIQINLSRWNGSNITHRKLEVL